MILLEAIEPWLPFVMALGALLLLHRLVTRVIITLFYRITGSFPLAMLLYALLIWPGTILHELSHWAVARLLGVYAQLPHLFPSKPNRRGEMVLGHVMIENTDIVRRSLIGVAPLVIGSIAVTTLAQHAFAFPLPSLTGGMGSLLPLIRALPNLLNVADLWLHLYVLFVIANAMMPSPSDREAWPALLLFTGLVGGLLFLTVGIPQLPTVATDWGLHAAAWLTCAFLITALLNAALLLVLLPLERLLRAVGR